MANPEHVSLLKRGTIVLNAWRRGNPHRAFDLREVYLDVGDLLGANLRDANIDWAQFVHIQFYGANFENATFASTIFINVDLGKASLKNTELTHTVFIQCGFNGSDFSGARLFGTVFANCNLRGAIGLDKVTHSGPSTIGIDTILRSEGDIPHTFLEGCGVPNHIIQFVDSIAKKPIQFYSCFLSHSIKDKSFAKHLFDKLQGASVRCWYFPESARIGEGLKDEINKAIRIYDKLVIICTRNSLNSQPVLDEIEEGLQREQEEKVRRNHDAEKVVSGEWTQEEFARQRYHTKVLFPIALDNYVFTDWNHPLKFELQKNRVIGDFRNWEDFKTFDKAFQKLLQDLNSSD